MEITARVTADAKVNTLKVHICTPIFQLSVTFELSVEVVVESVSEEVFDEDELHLVSAMMQINAQTIKAIFFILIILFF